MKSRIWREQMPAEIFDCPVHGWIASGDSCALCAKPVNTTSWNAALEAAALIVCPVPHVEEERRCEDIAADIRALRR